MRAHFTQYSLLFFLISSLPLCAQQDLTFSVKKVCPVTKEFNYMGKPVSPEALVGFFEIMSDESYSDTVSLKLHPYRVNTLHDTIKYQERSWCERSRSYMSYLTTETKSYSLVVDASKPNFFNSYIAYCVRQNTRDGRYIVEASYNTGGTITYECIFTLAIRGDYLIKESSLCKYPGDYFTGFAVKNDQLMYTSDTLNASPMGW